MSRQNEAYYVGATQINLGVLGASVFPTRIQPASGQVSANLKYVSGGSVVIFPNALSGATVSGATAALNGYVLGASEIFNIPGPAAFYVACGSAATAVISLAINYSAGGATLV